MNSLTALEGLTDDRLLGGRVALYQPAAGYRAAIDPVLLAASIPAREGQTVLEIGAGVGGAALCLAARVPGIVVHGLEIQADLVDVAALNIDRNRASGTVIRQADILDPPDDLPAAYDHVMANPPHLKATAARLPPNAAKAAANVEDGAGLGDWVSMAVSKAGRGGTVTFVHRFDRLADLDDAFSPQKGSATIYPLWRDASRQRARRVLYRWRNDGQGKRAVAGGMILHRDGGEFTARAEAVLRGGGAIDIEPGR